MGIFDPDEVITIHSLKEAIEDGVLVEIFKNRWNELSGGKPIVATYNVYEEMSYGELMEIWNRFVFWQKYIAPGREGEEGFFATEIGWKKIWVFDELVCFTVMFPEDY